MGKGVDVRLQRRDTVAADTLRECGETTLVGVAAADANVFFTVGLP